MKFLNLGGATGILEHNGLRFMFDPWLDEGIFHGAWHHYPPVDDEIKKNGVGRIDYIYISHIHEDHCSLKTLQEINKDAEIVIMDRTPNFVLQFLEKNDLNFKKIHLVKPYSKYKLSDGLYVDMITADPKHTLNFVIDSGLIIDWDGFVVYNSNDCPPYAEGIRYIQENYPNLTLSLLPYATGSSYPACFSNLSHEEKLEEKARLYKMGVDMFSSAASRLQSKYVMPFADQYVIVGRKQDLNRYMPHPASPGRIKEDLSEDLKRKLVLLNSGQRFDLSSGEKTPPTEYYQYTESEKASYALKHVSSSYEFDRIELSKSVNLEALLEVAASKLFRVLDKRNYKSQTSLVIEVYDWKKKFVISLNEYRVRSVGFSEEETSPFLKVKVSASLLSMMLIGQVSWNIADAALFIEYTRVPNNYDPTIQSLWNYIKI